MAFKRIEDSDLKGKGNVGRPDTPGVDTAEMQRILDEIPREIIVPAFNEMVRELNEDSVWGHVLMRDDGHEYAARKNLVFKHAQIEDNIDLDSTVVSLNTETTQEAIKAAERAEQSAKETAAVASRVIEIESSANQAKTIADQVNNRVDSLIVSGTPTEGNTELIDIRLGADGTRFQTAGEAVRSIAQGKGLLNSAITTDKINHPEALMKEALLENPVYRYGYFLDDFGVETANSNYLIVEYVLTGNELMVSHSCHNWEGSNYLTIAAYDSFGQMIASVKNTSQPTGGISNYTLAIPCNAATVKFSQPYNTWISNKFPFLALVSPGVSISDTLLNCTAKYFHSEPILCAKGTGYNLSDHYTLGATCYIKCPIPESINFEAIIKTDLIPDKLQIDVAFWKDGMTERVIVLENNFEQISDNGVYRFFSNFAFDASSITEEHTILGAIIQILSKEHLGDIGKIQSQFDILSAVVNGVEAEVIGYKNTVVQPITFFNENTTNPLFGKKLGFLGDSLTAVYYKTEEESWPHLIAKRNGARHFNYGISGNPLSVRDDCMANRISSMADDLDYIMVMGGANDYNIKAPIGENTDDTIATFKGAVNVCIDRLIEKYPAKKILFATTYQRTTTKADEVYANAMLEVCGLRCIPCLDNYHNSGVQMTNEKWMAVCGPNGDTTNKHLNAKGDEFVSWLFEAKLKSI